MGVPFFDMAAELASVRTDVDAAIKRVLDSGVFIGGSEVSAFERELAGALGVSFAVGLSSGTDALLATFMALGLGPGDEVVTTPFTFFATAGSIARLGATPVFVDIDESTMCMDPGLVPSAVTSRTKAIVPVNLFGFPAGIPATSVPIVEDAAQSIGAPLRGIAATLSFFPTKNIGALGDAGAVITNDESLADRIRLLRTQGARPKYHHIALGGNFRLDAVQAAVLRVKLERLGAWNRRRRELAEKYRSGLGAHSISDLTLPPTHQHHAHHQFVIRTPRRDALRAHLAANDIGTEVYYPEPLHQQPVFHGGAFPQTEKACREVLALPLHPSLPDASVDHVVDEIARFHRR